MDWLNPVTGPMIIIGLTIIIGLVLAFFEREEKNRRDK